MHSPNDIADLITEDADTPAEYRSAVAVVSNHQGTSCKWLLGLSNADDDRKGKWCFPGGGIKRNENPKDAAARECKEETGIRCHPVGSIVNYKPKPNVAFVRCKATNKDFKPNKEFTAMGWFTRAEMRSLKLYGNVLRLIDKVT